MTGNAQCTWQEVGNACLGLISLPLIPRTCFVLLPSGCNLCLLIFVLKSHAMIYKYHLEFLHRDMQDNFTWVPENMFIFSARNSSCGKVIFSQESVIHFLGGRRVSNITCIMDSSHGRRYPSLDIRPGASDLFKLVLLRPYPLLVASWSSLETCSSLLAWGLAPPPHI